MNTPDKDLPDHLLHHIILPRLSFKCLNRLKCISKNMYELISTDAKFAADQSRSADTSSSGFVYMTHSGLAFFPDPALIGVPDPSLNFLNPTSLTKIKLVTSTNGLLLLYGEFSGMESLCVCNPAIKEMVFVPFIDRGKKFSCEMGLAYDPCELPDRYTIVDPLADHHENGILYQFDVFLSETGKWTRSSQTVNIRTICTPIKAVCAKGVIYWLCGKFLLWFDAKRDLAGSLILPVVEATTNVYSCDVGVYAGEITFFCVWIRKINVWRLTGGSRWDRLHAVRLTGMVDGFSFICPVGFDGRFVYTVVPLKDKDNTKRLLGWEAEMGRVEEKGLVTLNEDWRGNGIFKYTNSMARVPQILNGTS
ncbi:F-box protein [Carex littledalei]|uniref:F-box protein n=1 Tax=Carex littledalei TaxID=544730 RepID=A0A833R2R3_9POAL|nr:F-box protein [Carex littledalei]